MRNANNVDSHSWAGIRAFALRIIA